MSGKVKCPVCGKGFEIEADLDVGDTTFCPSCYDELEITSLTPPQVKEMVNDLRFDDESDSDNDDMDNDDFDAQ